MTPDPASVDTGAGLVRVLAGADVVTVVETIEGDAEYPRAALDDAVRTMTPWAQATDFFAAAVLVGVDRPENVLVYSQRLMTAAHRPLDVPDVWRLGQHVGVGGSVATSYIVTLTRHDPASPARMQYLSEVEQTITVAQVDAGVPRTGQEGVDERAIARAQFVQGGIRSVAFHSARTGEPGLELVVWASAESLLSARRSPPVSRVDITGERWRVHTAISRKASSTAD